MQKGSTQVRPTTDRNYTNKAQTQKEPKPLQARPTTDRIYANKAQTHGICTNKAHAQTEPTQTGPRHQVNSNRKDHNRRNLQIQGLGTQGICTNKAQTQKESTKTKV